MIKREYNHLYDEDDSATLLVEKIFEKQSCTVNDLINHLKCIQENLPVTIDCNEDIQINLYTYEKDPSVKIVSLEAI